MDIQSSDATPIVQLADAPIPPRPPLGSGFDKSKLIMPAAILIAAVMVSGAVLNTRSSNSNNTAAIGGEPSLGDKIDIDVSGAPMLGNADAPVTVIEFGDFQCPFCGRYHQNVQSMIVNEYVNTGKVKFVWKDYAFLGPESGWAAEAARCAQDQGKFWEYHNYLYTHQNGENGGAFTKDNLKKFASAVGLNASQFNSCLDSGKYTALIQKESQDAIAASVNGTPATFINGKMVLGSDGQSAGASPYGVFKAFIDEELD